MVKKGDKVRVAMNAQGKAKAYRGQIVTVENTYNRLILVVAEDGIGLELGTSANGMYGLEYEEINDYVLPEKWWVKPNSLKEAKVVANWFDENWEHPYNSDYYVQKCESHHKEGYGYAYGIIKGGSLYYGCPSTAEEITFEQFKKYVLKQPSMDKKIIGYKAPIDLFGGIIKAGHLYKPLASSNPTTYCAMSVSGQVPLDSGRTNLPKEIVETWEPVYEDVPVYKVEDWITVTQKNVSGYWLMSTNQRTFQLTHEPTAFQPGMLWSTSGPYNRNKVGRTGYGIPEDWFRKATPEEIEKGKTASFNLGSKKVQVDVSKDGVFCRGKQIRISTIKKICEKFTEALGKATDEWDVEVAEVKFRVGCITENNLFTLEDFKQVLDIYKELQ